MRKTGPAVGGVGFKDFSPSYPPRFRIDAGALMGWGGHWCCPLHTTCSGHRDFLAAGRARSLRPVPPNISFRAHASKTGPAVGEGGVEDFSPLISHPLCALLLARVTGAPGGLGRCPFTPGSTRRRCCGLGDPANEIFLRPCAGLDLPTSHGLRMIFRPSKVPGPTPILPAAVTACGASSGGGLPSDRTRRAGLSRFALRDSFGRPGG
jgi:hypothetical protein